VERKNVNVMDTLKKQYAAYKGHFTRSQTQFEEMAGAAQKMGKATPIVEDQMRRALTRAQDFLDKMGTTLERLEEKGDKEVTEKHLKDFEKHQDITLKMIKVAAAISVEQCKAKEITNTKAAEAVKPFNLQIDAVPATVTNWVKRVETYLKFTGLNGANTEEQQIVMFAFMDSELCAIIQPKCGREMPVMGENSCLGVVEAYFTTRYPLIQRRNDALVCYRNQDEDVMTWYGRLTQLAREAQIAEMRGDDFMVLIASNNVNNPVLRDRIYRLEKPLTLEKVEGVFKAHTESASNQRSAEGGAHAEAMAAYQGAAQQQNRGRPQQGQQRRGGQQQGAQGQQQQQRQRNPGNNRCYRCNSQYHLMPSCPVPPTHQCDICKKKGHTKWACHSGQPTNVATAATEKKKKEEESTNACAAVSTSAIPPLTLNLSTENGGFKTFTGIADTGAGRSLVSLGTVQRCGGSVRSSPATIRTADGVIVNVDGVCNVRMQTKQGKVIECEALVMKHLVKDFLLGIEEQKKLGMIHPDYPNHALMAENQDSVENVMTDFNEVFSDKTKGGSMGGVPMKIVLNGSNVKPLHIYTTKQTPVHLQEMADKLKEELLEQDIITRVSVPTTWCSPAKFLEKPGGKKVRLVTDYSQLNKCVSRPVHPFPCASDIVKMIKHDSKIFAKLDATHGYFQIPLDEESQLLTTFLLPDGRYCYKAAPMGLNCSGDEFCARTDEALRGLPFVSKLVDDCLIQAPDYQTLCKYLRIFLERCKKHGITLSKSKVEIGESVLMAGYVVSKDGVKPDPKKVSGIAEFKSPKDLTELRRFLGMVNQLAVFFPELTGLVAPLRALQKKNVAFNWTDSIEEAFVKCKKYLTSDAVVKPYVQGMETRLLTDASRLNGLGYILMQVDKKGGRRVVQCGSRSTSSAEKNYANIELECLGVQWAMDQCKYFLRGCPQFHVITDHKPLVGIFAKSLVEIENNRLRRLMEKTLGYNFDVTWVAGKEHLIADALSRAPVDEAVCVAAASEGELEKRAKVAKAVVDDPALGFIKNALTEKSYRELIEAFMKNEKVDSGPYRRVWDEMNVVEERGIKILLVGDRVVVPETARRSLMKFLHIPHAGVAKTVASAKRGFYWPTMNNDIGEVVRNCEVCTKLKPSQRQEPMRECTASHPMQKLGVDLFHENGKNYMVVVDRFSGFPWVTRLTQVDTSAVTGKLQQIFNDFGYPEVIRSDGGPQFRDKFTRWCKGLNIIHEQSSPYNPQSNGLAEAAVKNMKKLVLACREQGVELGEALLEWRSTPRTDGVSPALAMLKREPRTRVPIPNLRTEFHDERLQVRRSARMAEQFNKRALTKEREPLTPGTEVYVQNKSSGKWSDRGVVSSERTPGRSYTVRLSDGGVTARASRYLKTR